MNNREYQLSRNDGVNHLHGGFKGFNKKVWKLESEINRTTHSGVVFSYISKDGEEGYPGNVKVTCTYLLTIFNELEIKFEAISDRSTIINLTNHTYFNLSGFEQLTIYDHQLRIFADAYTVKNEKDIPTGAIAPIKDTVLDFSTPRAIGQCIHELKTDRGYNHNFVLKKDTSSFCCCAQLSEPSSGRTLKLFTDQPGLQVYTANWWDGTIRGVQGKDYIQHGAIALETQAFPDSPNHIHFPNTFLKPGERYQTTTIFQF
jgi:aldose 1-epimerase